VLFAAFLFSTGGAAIKATTLSAWQVAGLRSGIAAVAVLLMLKAARRWPDGPALAVGLGYAATLILFVQATKLTTAANAIFLQATAPLYVVLLSPWILREPVRRRDLAFLAILAPGVVLFFVGAETPQATAPAPLLGNILGAATGLTWACTICGLRLLERRAVSGGAGAASAIVAGNGIAFLAASPWAFPLHGVGARDGILLVYLGVVQIGVAYVCLAAGLRHVAALPAMLLLFVEPVFNPVWTFLVHGERIAAWSLLGGVLILGTTLAKNLLDLRPAAAGADN